MIDLQKKNHKKPHKKQKTNPKGSKANFYGFYVVKLQNYSRYTIAATKGLSKYLMSWK